MCSTAFYTPRHMTMSYVSVIEPRTTGLVELSPTTALGRPTRAGVSRRKDRASCRRQGAFAAGRGCKHEEHGPGTVSARYLLFARVPLFFVPCSLAFVPYPLGSRQVPLPLLEAKGLPSANLFPISTIEESPSPTLIPGTNSLERCWLFHALHT